MPGIGSNPFGSFSMGSVAGIDQQRSLADFNFTVKAKSYGRAIEVTIDIPDLNLVGSNWSRELKVLRKSGEWPQGEDDAVADILFQHSYASEGNITETILDLGSGSIGLSPLNTYYYSLYEKRNDGVWIHDPTLGRGSAYPYDRWGFGDYLYSNLPRGWQRADTTQDLYNFCQLFGAILDDTKTDVEYLRTLFEINSIHEDLIPYLDDKIAWPTWLSAGGLRKRKETASAVGWYKLIGTASGFESVIEDVSLWDATITEGWKYVMFTNGLYDSITPIPSDPSYRRSAGTLADKFKYTNDNTTERRWHSVNGLVLYLNQLPVSGEFNAGMIARYFELIDLIKASYANVALLLAPSNDEVYPLSSIIDDYDTGDDHFGVPEEILVPEEEDLGYTTADVTLFLSEPNGNGSLTPDTTSPPADTHFRTFHEALEYI